MKNNIDEVIVLSDSDDEAATNKNQQGSEENKQINTGIEKIIKNGMSEDFIEQENDKPGDNIDYFGADDYFDLALFDPLEVKNDCPIPNGNMAAPTQLKINDEMIMPPLKRLKKCTSGTSNGSTDERQRSEGENDASDDVEKPALKRKKRTKEEIEQQKLEKDVNRIRRQIQQAKNSKCEQYLYCHFSTRILRMDESLKDELKKRFEERGIPNQIIYDSSPAQIMRIIWRKKCIDAWMEDGKLVNKENMELQSCYCCVLSGETFTVLAKTKNGLLQFLEEQTASHKIKEARPTLIILGKHTVRENAVDSIIFEAYERFRAQFRFVRDALDFGFLIVQIHRALAKFDKKAEKQTQAEEMGTDGMHILAEKGILDGPEMVADWWSKMLDHVHRMSEDQKRAIVQAHPNPFKLMDQLLNPQNSPGDSMFRLSEIQMESGRRLGPILAQKIYMMLTSLDGEEIIDTAGN